MGGDQYGSRRRLAVALGLVLTSGCGDSAHDVGDDSSSSSDAETTASAEESESSDDVGPEFCAGAVALRYE
ncbi:MAG TPA: hypothetical protein VFG69_14395, partial [Nannocystaceae bacterium]|nr:hypothetical protein [Nannocystaceae bacterium]